MHKKPLWAALLAVPLLVAAAVYAKTLFLSQPTDTVSVAAENSDQSQCCQSDKLECCQSDKLVCRQPGNDDTPRQTEKTPGQQIDPDRQIVFKVEELTCPAVKGIGCGHMLRPVLASLDKIDGVEASSANYTGTMIRISVKTGTDRERVAERVRKALCEKNGKPVALVGDKLKQAIEREQWRETGRIGELSAIEFHTLFLHRVKTFAKAEKLDVEATDKLVKIAEQQWERVTKQAEKDGTTEPEDWGNQGKKSLPISLERVKEVLTAEQVERFKQALTSTCCSENRPEAPSAPTKREKAR
jgi:hypothetical protein